MSRSTSQSSTATINTSHGMSRSLSVKTNSKPLPQPLDPLPASDVKLFVTNLRLLDLDLRADWPGITVQTFSGKNADQRQRISGAEWALFRLFEIWDPNETAQKLQPFFPPLEPLQSLNLRAALYRSLNELKKNGVLGREAVLRKTMLDECKGEKFFEILAIFSNAALKKVLAARGRAGADAAIALKLATAPMLSAPQQQSLLPLAIAHRAALVTLLKRKEVRRRRYVEFEALLDSKAEDINRRIRKSKDIPRANRPAVSQKDTDAVKKQLKDNWIGNQKWLDVMLHGDDVQTGEAFLGSRFDKIWRMVEHGRKLQDVTPETGLLDSLQARVQEQQERLQKWEAFHERLQQEKHQPATAASKVPVVTKEFKFDSHLQFQLSSSKRNATESTSVQQQDMQPEYRGILDEMNTRLSSIISSKAARDVIPPSKRRMSSSGARSPARSRENTRSESKPVVPISPTRSRRPSYPKKNPSLEQAPVLLPPRCVPFTAPSPDSDATLIDYTSAAHSIAPATCFPHILGQQIESPGLELDTTTVTFDAPQESPPFPPKVAVEGSPQPVHRSPSPEPASAYPSEPPTPIVEPSELNTEEVLAELIITSIGDATPSPVKKPQPQMSMSLIERTRMSMARTNSFEPVAESPLPLPSPQLPEILTTEADTDRRATLLERTRLSMMSMQAKPRQMLSARERKEKQQSRQSLFPVNQFDTPRTRKSFEIIEESKSTDPELTPKEALFNDEIDYDRVFKSRPRIATSPVFSPLPNDNEEDYDDEDVDGVTGIDLGDVDQDEEDDGFTKSWADSPSRMRAGKVKY